MLVSTKMAERFEQCHSAGLRYRPRGWTVGLAVFSGTFLLAAGSVSAQGTGPEILRGSVAPPPPAKVEPAAGYEAELMTAGERLWIVDRDGKKLTACRLINTIYVGGQAIRCTTRKLPRSARREG